MKNIKILKTEGPRPFITKLIFSDYNGKVHTWESRLLRKGINSDFLKDFKTLPSAFWSGFKKIDSLNWWISIIFALGSFLFMLGSVLSLKTSWALFFKLSTVEVNFIYFLGSIPFTTAAFLQLLQAYMSGKKQINSVHSSHKQKFLQLLSLGFLSALFQFGGTLLFNMNTFEGTKLNLSVLQSDILVWVPDFVGSVLFLISGYLAFIEVAHSYWKLELTSISWWVVFINLLGCIAFMISAFYAFVPKGGASNFAIELATIFTFIGGLCFFIGALLMLPEMGVQKISAPKN